jgi:UV DNA damage endonuclease
MMRLGLCCTFNSEPIKFRTATAKSLSKLSKKERNEKIAKLCRLNAEALLKAFQYCAHNQIGDFRVNSQILPLRTHPDFGYHLQSLPGGGEIIEIFCECGKYAHAHNIRSTFHPDQFILLSSLNPEIIKKSIEELDYHAEVSEWIGADVINIHGGGAYGNKKTALETVERGIKKLSSRIRERLTLENDDRVYTPFDILPLCEKLEVPFVYDVHHHRCLPDGLSIEIITERALKTWNREALFHLSSPREGWSSKTPQYHHDYINIDDFPACWQQIPLTIEIEAKAKEKAVKRFREDLQSL